MITVRKIAACMMAGAIILSGHTATAKAAEKPIAGIDLSLPGFFITPLTADLGVSLLSLPKKEEKEYRLAFAKVDDYVNIRTEPSEDGELLGKLYKDSAATIISKEGDWYKIKSGSVTGYIKSEFLLTGEQAEAFSKTAGKKIAVVNTTTLRVRQKASKKSAVLTLVPRGDEYKVTKEKEGWVKIKVGNNITGYVSKAFVKLKRVYVEARSIEEEQKEQALQLMAVQSQASREESDSAVKKSASNISSESFAVAKKASYESASSSSSIRSKIVDYALQFEGNPYVWGGTSLTRGADCSGFTQSVFEDYGIYIPRTSREQATSGRRVSLDEIRPGDLIFYTRNGSINHVALYIGNGKVIAAKSPSEGIRITNYNYRTPYKAVSYIN